MGQFITIYSENVHAKDLLKLAVLLGQKTKLKL